MNVMTALDLTNGKKSQNLAYRTSFSLKGITDLASKAMAAIHIDRHEATSRNGARYRIGDAVHHARFGNGQVLAIWPDGRLQVRFKTKSKNQLIFSSLLSTD